MKAMTKINFSGNIDEVKKQIEQAVATYELLGNRSSVNFDEWFEKWKQGFPAAIENRALGNYGLTGDRKWRDDASKRPRWREWGKEAGIIAGEYWRDRSNEDTSIPLIGTSEQLIQHIIQIEYEGGGTSASKNKNGSWPLLRGQPQIKFYFLGDNKASAEISLRIMSKTDDLKSPLPKIDKSDLRAYARRIKEEFATPSLFEWQKGRDVISYRNRYQGFEGWYLCRSESSGRRLLTKLLAIDEQMLDEASIRFTTAPASAFPVSPPPITVLGEVIAQQIERPLVDVWFYRAEIILSKLKLPIPLVERALIVYQ